MKIFKQLQDPDIKLQLIRIEGNQYLVSNEEIKEGDWLIDTNVPDIYQAKIDAPFPPTRFVHKILASNDPSLNLPDIKWNDVEELSANFIKDSKKDVDTKIAYRIGFEFGYTSNPNKYDDEFVIGFVKSFEHNYELMSDSTEGYLYALINRKDYNSPCSTIEELLQLYKDSLPIFIECQEIYHYGAQTEYKPILHEKDGRKFFRFKK